MMTAKEFHAITDLYAGPVIGTAKAFLRDDKRVNEVLKNVFTIVYGFNITDGETIRMITTEEISFEFKKMSKEFIKNYKKKV